MKREGKLAPIHFLPLVGGKRGENEKSKMNEKGMKTCTNSFPSISGRKEERK